MVEYVLLLGLVTLALLTAFSSLGLTCLHLFQRTVDAFAP
jgi:Flp pilus assembly pilin Flp